MAERHQLLDATATALRDVKTSELLASLSTAKIACTLINDIAAVRTMPAIASRLNQTTVAGATRHLPPAAVDLPGLPRLFPQPPAFAEHTEAVLSEVGFTNAEIAAFLTNAISALAPSAH